MIAIDLHICPSKNAVLLFEKSGQGYEQQRSYGAEDTSYSRDGEQYPNRVDNRGDSRADDRSRAYTAERHSELDMDSTGMTRALEEVRDPVRADSSNVCRRPPNFAI